MKTSEKIYQLRTNLMKLKAGGHVSPGSLAELLPKKELKKLYEFWYDEKPLGDIVKPDAVLRYEEMLQTANSLEQERRRLSWNEFPDIYSDLVEQWYELIYGALDFLSKEQKKDPALCLWFDYEVPADRKSPYYIPSSIGMDRHYLASDGFGFCPAHVTIAEKVTALEASLKAVCDRYEGKVLESFMTDPASSEVYAHEYR